MPECHSGWPGSTPGGRTTTCSSGSTARCKRATVRIVTAARLRLHASAEDSKRSSKAHWVGSIPTGSTLPRSTSGEVIGFSSRTDGLDTHTRCPCLCWRTQPLCYERSCEGSTPSRDSRLSPRDLAATFRPSHDAVRLCAGAPPPATSSDERALIWRSARARLPPPGPAWDRLTVGREPLTLVIVVRIHVPRLCGVSRLVLGMLLQSIAARFDPEAPYQDLPP